MNEFEYTADLGFGFGGSASVGGLALFNLLMSDPEVVKSLQATGTLPKVGPGIDAAGVEDLTSVMALAEVREEQLYLWREIPKVGAHDLVIQGTRMDRTHGNYYARGFIGTNSSGNVSDPRLARYTQEIKFMAVKGQVTLPTQFARYVTQTGIKDNSAMQIAEDAAMLTLLKLQEWAIPFADASVDASEYNGIYAQIAPQADADNGILWDLRGLPPDKDFLEALSERASINSASPTHFHIPAPVRRDLRQSLFPQFISEEAYRGAVGVRFDQYMVETLAGGESMLKIRRNQMMTLGVKDGMPRYVPTLVSPNAPSAVSAVGGAFAAHTATDDAPGVAAGTYYYSVVAVGEGGAAAATASGGIVNGTAGFKAQLTITCTDPDVSCFMVFRNPEGVSGVSASNRQFMCRVARTGNVTAWEDTGYWLPGCSQAAYLSQRPDELRWRQLMPIMKRPLPQGLMDNTFGILHFGTVELPAPTHHIWIKNIGERVQSGVRATSR